MATTVTCTSIHRYHFRVPRTKWKRQTAVGLEFLAEGGYGRLMSGYWPYATPPTLATPSHPSHLSAVGALSSMAALSSSMDIYYRHAQLAALSRTAAAVTPASTPTLEGTPSLPALTTVGATSSSSPPTLVAPRQEEEQRRQRAGVAGLGVACTSGDRKPNWTLRSSSSPISRRIYKCRCKRSLSTRLSLL
ncbi:hypothetical protein O3P69_000098 [Scylla paramamosain]|uniref:Uncharacterized protein n=1 Tax=Scylla paramamosain TaxID=85552 RepID=A0AAW0UV36_SCYPA